MKTLIYQVCIGKAAKSKLYKHCMQSVKDYCEAHGIDYIRQDVPVLRIKPDVFRTNRSKESYEKHGGYLPIYEKENAFSYLEEYDRIAIIDADIYIRPDSPNIFDDFNDQLEDARELAAFCSHVPCKVNIIEYNPIDEGLFQQAEVERVSAFVALLESRNIIVNVRRSRGKDIDAACGQLANKNAAGLPQFKS